MQPSMVTQQPYIGFRGQSKKRLAQAVRVGSLKISAIRLAQEKLTEK